MRQQKDKQNAAAEANAIDKSDQNLNQYNQMRWQKDKQNAVAIDASTDV